MNPELPESDVSAIVELANMAEQNGRNIIRDEKAPFPRFFIPNGDTYNVKEFGGDLPNPLHMTGAVSLHTSQALVDFVKTYKGTRDVAIYLDATQNKATAVFGHHGADKAGWCGFKAELLFTLDPRFKRWLDLNNKWLDQQAFAEFLEDNGNNIAEPDASTLIDIISDLKVNKTVNVQSTRVLRNGDIRLQWDETSAETKTVPSEFKLTLPVYARQKTLFGVTARLRYRFADRQLKWLFIINEMESLLLEAWQRETLLIRDAESICPIWDGSPAGL